MPGESGKTGHLPLPWTSNIVNDLENLNFYYSLSKYFVDILTTYFTMLFLLFDVIIPDNISAGAHGLRYRTYMFMCDRSREPNTILYTCIGTFILLQSTE